jgi:predicted acylesterase/phospholipase RssA
MSFDSIVLCGGGIKGFSILGGIQYMMDQKLFSELKYFSGTSIGSIICYFLAIGYTPIEMVIYVISNNVFDQAISIDSLESVFKGEGFINFDIFKSHFEKMTMDKLGYVPTLLELYEKMGKILFTTTYNITKKKKEYISYMTYPEMSCIDAIKLSSSLPFIFNDCVYNGDTYIDGGFVDNCPFSPLLEHTDKVVIFKIEQKNLNEYKTIIDKFYTVINVPTNELSNVQMKENKCKIVNIETEAIRIYEFNLNNSKKLELFSIGYNCAKKIFE